MCHLPLSLTNEPPPPPLQHITAVYGQISAEGNLQDLGRLVDGIGNAAGRATDSLVRRRREAFFAPPDE